MTCYYNDSDPFVCQWLRNLIAAGHLPTGDVDERPIQEVQPDDVRGYTQAHFFAGIGGWAYALPLAGWGDRPVWTGSCPCQPFSAAGKGQGVADPRHLWPEWFRLIRECHPPVVFGEQVAAAIRHGWLDTVFGDLEREGYTCGATVLGAHSVGAPHIRQRLWFVADAMLYRSGWASQQDDEADQERNISSCRPVRTAILHAPESGLQPSWPPGPGRISEIPRATDGFPDHMGGHDAYGNAIVPQVAAAFVSAYLET